MRRFIHVNLCAAWVLFALYWLPFVDLHITRVNMYLLSLSIVIYYFAPLFTIAQMLSLLLLSIWGKQKRMSRWSFLMILLLFIVELALSFTIISAIIPHNAP
ncbi:hypothetical protein OAT16_05575 [Prolixibacteraceae bacterium]|nr:hypothetical protein [Prolixibacteraceae bacterium]